MKKFLPVLLLAFIFFSCKKENPSQKSAPVLYPTQITRTFSNSSDVVKLQYTYNAQNQIIKEESFRNNVLERTNKFGYNANGRLDFKHVYGSTGHFLEQDELFYNSGKLEKLHHSYIDTAGVPGLHHINTYTYDSEGRISRITELAPDRTLVKSRTYNFQPNNRVESAGTGDHGQFMDKIAVAYDGKLNPFANTNITLVKFAGNELKMELKNQSDQVVFSYINSLDYNAEGYPVKRVQTISDGSVITETYTYKEAE